MNKILQDNINKRKQRRSLLMKKLDYQKNNFVFNNIKANSKIMILIISFFSVLVISNLCYLICDIIYFFIKLLQPNFEVSSI